MLDMTHFEGPSRAPTLLIAHGLFGSARNWRVIAKHLSIDRPVITVDMRNHGNSFHAPEHSYEALAEDLAAVIRSVGGPVDVLGHSMGGKASMLLALTSPDLVRRLIVGDIAPVTYSHSQMQYIDAMRAVDLSQVARRSDAAKQLEAKGVEPALQAFFTQSLDLKKQAWLYNLDALEAEMPKIMSFPEVSRTFDKPVFVLCGAESDYVRVDHRPAFRRLFGQARFAKLTGAGHWLHADKPKEFVAAANAFLSADI